MCVCVCVCAGGGGGGGLDMNSNGWWDCGGQGQRRCFAYVIAAMGRGLHMLLDPQGTNSACFIIENSHTTQHKTTGLIPKQTDPCGAWVCNMPVCTYEVNREG